MNPNGLRVGIIKDWNSKWYADSKHFADYLVEDHKIREYVKKKLYASGKYSRTTRKKNFIQTCNETMYAKNNEDGCFRNKDICIRKTWWSRYG